MGPVRGNSHNNLCEHVCTLVAHLLYGTEAGTYYITPFKNQCLMSGVHYSMHYSTIVAPAENFRQ